jgi:hypothetical protein
MVGRGQPPPALHPRHPNPTLPGVRAQSAAAAATVLPPPLPNPSSRQHAPPPATLLHQMFSTCVARGIAAKLVYKTVGGKVVTSLYCSSANATSAAAAAAAHVPQKQGRKRPDNERRRMRREAWQQRRFSSKPASETIALTAAAVSTVSEKDCSTAAKETAVVKTVQCLAQAAMPAAQGAATAAPSTAAATPPRGWVLEPRNGLVVMARRIPEHSLESPETIRDPGCCQRC